MQGERGRPPFRSMTGASCGNTFRSMGAEATSGTQGTIVVGYDGTAPAEHALGRAAEYARAFTAKVVVVSVAAPQPLAEVGAPGAFGLMPYAAYPAGDPDQVVERDEQLWEQHRQRAQALFADADLQVDFAGVAGEPAQELVDAAEQRQAELIIVGTREPGFLERLLGGSVSQDVARRARCDVLIVHPGDE
jgi:nucleotide-binding universal stress UspA family protein